MEQKIKGVNKREGEKASFLCVSMSEQSIETEKAGMGLNKERAEVESKEAVQAGI